VLAGLGPGRHELITGVGNASAMRWVVARAGEAVSQAGMGACQEMDRAGDVNRSKYAERVTMCGVPGHS